MRPKTGSQTAAPVQQMALTIEQDRVLFILLIQWQAHFADALLDLGSADLTRPEALAFLSLIGFTEDKFWGDWFAWQG